MAECSSCVICETTFCIIICVLTSQESKDKKRGRDGKERQKWRGCVSFKMPLLHKSLVLTRPPQGLALLWPLQGTVSWCSAPEQGGNTEAWILQGRGFPTSSLHGFCLCLAASSPQAVSLALCKSSQQKREASNEPGMLGWGCPAKVLQAGMPWGRGCQHPHPLQHPN